MATKLKLTAAQKAIVLNSAPEKRKSGNRKSENVPFRALMTQQRSEVHAALQLWGDFPDCTPEHCREMDWIHTIMSHLADVAEQARLDDGLDPLITKALKRRLARLAAACEMWADQLEGK